jgi:hypothetical protein
MNDRLSTMDINRRAEHITKSNKRFSLQAAFRGVLTGGRLGNGQTVLFYSETVGGNAVLNK